MSFSLSGERVRMEGEPYSRVPSKIPSKMVKDLMTLTHVQYHYLVRLNVEIILQI